MDFTHTAEQLWGRPAPSPGGKIASCKGNDPKTIATPANVSGSWRCDAEELAAHQAGKAKCEKDAWQHAEEGHPGSLPEDQTQHVARGAPRAIRTPISRVRSQPDRK